MMKKWDWLSVCEVAAWVLLCAIPVIFLVGMLIAGGIVFAGISWHIIQAVWMEFF